jgi:hypothetical protein
VEAGSAPVTDSVVIFKWGNVMDEKLIELFMKWLGFRSCAKDLNATLVNLSDVESQIAAIPADGLRGLVVTLGLHQFLNDHADAASVPIRPMPTWCAWPGMIPRRRVAAASSRRRRKDC